MDTYKGLLGNTIGNFAPTPRGNLGGLASITGTGVKPSKKIVVKARMVYDSDLDSIRNEVLCHISDIPTVCVRHSKLTLRTQTAFKNLQGVFAYQDMPFSELMTLISQRVEFVRPQKDGTSKSIDVPKDLVAACLNAPFHILDPAKFGLRVFEKNEACIELSVRGNVEPSDSNIETLLLHDPSWKNMLRFNELSATVERGGQLPSSDLESEGSALTLVDVNELIIWLDREYGLKVTGKSVERVIRQIAEKHGKYHPVLDYLNALPEHDGKQRLDYWLIDLFNAECPLCKSADCEYLRKAGRWFLLSAISRAYTPGCQADYVLVLEGAQGVGKTSALAALVGGVGDVFSSTKLDFKSKDRFICLRGQWLYCLDELAYSDVDEAVMKNFITDRADNYRGVFATDNGKVKRRCVMCATVNPSEDKSYLKAGDRRWWPVTVSHEIDVKAIEHQRDQLWAEAHAAWKAAQENGEAYWPESVQDKELFNQHINAVAETVTPSAWHERVYNVIQKQIVADVRMAIEKRLDVTKTTHITTDGVLAALDVPEVDRCVASQTEPGRKAKATPSTCVRNALKKLGLEAQPKHDDFFGHPGRGYKFVDRDAGRRAAIATVLRAKPEECSSRAAQKLISRLLEPTLNNELFRTWAHGNPLSKDHTAMLPVLRTITSNLGLVVGLSSGLGLGSGLNEDDEA